MRGHDERRAGKSQGTGTERIIKGWPGTPSCLIFVAMNLSARLLLFLAIVTMGLAACGTLDVFEKNVSFKNQQWPGSEKPSFSFHVSDTASLYNIYLVFRHTNAYSYNNLWLKILRT